MAFFPFSGDITRDKTVQSCMRMRQLMAQQSILFWASHEADIRLREISGKDEITSEHVMEFIQNNSRKFEMANMPHWTSDALNYTKKIIGHRMYETSKSQSDSSKLEELYNACVDNDSVKLIDIYDKKKEVPLSEIAWNKFSKFSLKCKEMRQFVRKKGR